ncbi:MAG TPA: polysaccharide deacetylase family protein [Solirubrobacteraceae bacterium]|nr:polysaccharide deacetylase family protein [Solirubrobacteraceae bacterium]
MRFARSILSAACAAALLALALTGCGSGAGALGSAQIRSPLELIAPLAGDSSKPAGALYRIVGCHSRGDVAYTHGPHRYEVAIGFDDGPDTDTPAFVRMLASNHATATFFVIGEQVSSTFRETMLRELREGDVLGDHTFTHPDLTRAGDVRGQLQRTLSAIRAQTGYTPCVFRPPYGSSNSSVVRTAASLGLATVTWNVDPSDYTQPGTGAIEQRVLAQVQPGSIIISHDGGGPRGQTLAAYPKIISALRRRGYGIVTIPQLLGFRPVYERCVTLCDGIGVPRREVPREAIVQRAP